MAGFVAGNEPVQSKTDGAISVPPEHATAKQQKPKSKAKMKTKTHFNLLR